MRDHDPVLEALAEELAWNIGGIDYQDLDEQEKDDWRERARQMERRRRAS